MIPNRKISSKSISLLTTLGSEPQVITAAVDLLNRASLNINRLFVFHTAPEFEPITSSLERLNQYLSKKAYPSLVVTYISVQSENEKIKDFDKPQSSQAFFKTFYRMLWQEKGDNHCVHICASGGRKTMAMYAMAAAQLLFDDEDCFWHLYSSGEFLESKRMHPEPKDEAALVEVPVIFWSALSPVGSLLRQAEDPYQAIEKIKELGLQKKRKEAEVFFLNNLSPAQQRVVTLLVESGLSDIQIADQLSISPRTVERHLSDVYLRAMTHWELEDRVTRTQLITLLQLFFSTKLGENPQDKG